MHKQTNKEQIPIQNKLQDQPYTSETVTSMSIINNSKIENSTLNLINETNIVASLSIFKEQLNVDLVIKKPNKEELPKQKVIDDKM